MTIKNQAEELEAKNFELTNKNIRINDLEDTIRKQHKEIDAFQDNEDSEDHKKTEEMLEEKQRMLELLQQELEEKEINFNKKQAELNKREQELKKRESSSNYTNIQYNNRAQKKLTSTRPIKKLNKTKSSNKTVKPQSAAAA